MSHSYISMVEKGSKNISLVSLKRLAKVYNMPVSKIFYFEEIQHQLQLDREHLMIEILKYYLYELDSQKKEECSYGTKVR